MDGGAPVDPALLWLALLDEEWLPLDDVLDPDRLLFSLLRRNPSSLGFRRYLGAWELVTVPRSLLELSLWSGLCLGWVGFFSPWGPRWNPRRVWKPVTTLFACLGRSLWASCPRQNLGIIYRLVSRRLADPRLVFFLFL